MQGSLTFEIMHSVDVSSRGGEQRRLHPGVDYSTWPQLKLVRARQLVSELMDRIDVDAHTRPRLLIAEISADQLEVTFHAPAPQRFPIEEWSLLLGDAFHNYRSALDALAWEMAHLDGGSPTDAMSRRIYFPIFVAEDDWHAAASSHLSTVPPDILARFESVQPFQVPPAEDGIAVLLHEMDVADKHRGLLRITLRPLEPQMLHYRLVNEDGNGIHEHDFELIPPPEQPADPYPVFRLRSSTPIAHAEAPMGVPMLLELVWRGKSLNALDVIDLVDRQVIATFDIVNTGFHDESDPSGDGT